MLNEKNYEKLISEAIAIETQEAKEAGAIGYLARALVNATMPHKNPIKSNIWGRRNGIYSLVIQSGYTIDKNNNFLSIGLPYGIKPRLVMAFISSEAVRTRSRKIVLGRSLSEFMNRLGLVPTGGRWGTIPMLREQMRRLFSATISFQYDKQEAEISGGFRIASNTVLFWDSKSHHQRALWESTVTLTQEFYEEITERPVPLDMRALSALKSSSLAIDIYCWLTYRMSYLKKSIEIPWAILAMQFGSDYSEIRDFKKNFLKQLRKVLVVYSPNIQEGEIGLVLKASKVHVPFRSQEVSNFGET
jgi:hypothetical protein